MSTETIDCENCGGLGLVDHVWTQAEKSFSARYDIEMEDYMETCTRCGGTGEVASEPR